MKCSLLKKKLEDLQIRVVLCGSCFNLHGAQFLDDVLIL